MGADAFRLGACGLLALLVCSCASGGEFEGEEGGFSGAAPDTGSSDASRDREGADSVKPGGDAGHHHGGDAGRDRGASGGDAESEATTDAGSDSPLFCIIGGATYGAGTINPSDACQTCVPSMSTSSWVDAPDGTSCGTDMFCTGGACSTGCYISGSFYASAAKNPMNACQSCQPALSTTAWSDSSDGSGCGSGMVCTGGSCSSGCYIGGYVSTGTLEPGNDCQSCQPAASTTGWTPLADESSCSGGSCCSATCVDESTDTGHCGACGTTCPTVANGTATCSSGSCGINCDSGYVLSAGSCISSSCPVTFPSSTSTTGGPDAPGVLGVGGGGVRYRSGDYVSQTFVCAVPSVTQLAIDFQMSDDTEEFVYYYYYTCDVGTLSWDVFLNGTSVGTYSWLGGSGPTTHTVSGTLTFPAVAAIAGSYTIEYIATSTVCSGGGAWNWIAGGSATLD